MGGLSPLALTLSLFLWAQIFAMGKFGVVPVLIGTSLVGAGAVGACILQGAILRRPGTEPLIWAALSSALTMAILAQIGLMQ